MSDNDSGDNSGEGSASPSSSDVVTNTAAETLPSEDADDVAKVKDEFDTDAIVDELTIEDLRDLTKRILRVAKENKDEKILSEVNFLVQRQQHQRQDQSSENVEEESNASDSVDQINPSSTALDPTHPDFANSIGTENNREEESKPSDLADHATSSSISEDPSLTDAALSLPLPNTESVEKDSKSSDSADLVTSSSLLDPSHPDSILSLPPLLRNSRSHDSDKSDAAKPISPKKSTEKDTSRAPMSPTERTSNKQRNEVARIPMSPTVRTSNKQRGIEMPMMPDGNESSLNSEELEGRSSGTPGLGKRQLVILCNRKPATAKESKDQDLAMTLCKNMGIIPCVIVSTLSSENSTATKEEQLLAESMPPKESGEVGDIPWNSTPSYTYPQFFVRNILRDPDSDESNSIIDYKGDYDTMEELYRTGKFGADSLEAIPVSSEKGAAVSSDTPEDETSKSVESRTDIDLDRTNNSSGNKSNNSSGSTNNMSTSHRSNTSLSMSMDSLQNGSQNGDASYSHLEGMNQPKTRLSANSDGFGEMSLGDDLRMIFDIDNEVVTISNAEEANESQATTPAAPAAVPTTTEEEEEESNATPVKVELAAVPTIIEEEEEDDESESEVEEKEVQDDVGSEQEHEKTSSVSMTVLSSGAIVKQETVMLKSRRPKVEPPGAVVLDNHSSRLFTQARGSLKSPPSSPVKVSSTVKPAESQPKKIMNPYYALSQYSGGKGGDDPPGDDAEAIQTLAQDSIKETIDPPEDDGALSETSKQGRKYLPWEKKFIGIGACYLIFHVYDDELNIHYSESPMANAVGVWTSPDIASFKESQGLSECELIGTCASRVTQDAKNFCQGWCQFIKAAKIMDGTVTALQGVGIPVEFYLYDNGRTIQVSACDGEAVFDTKVTDAVACVPKGRDFPATGIMGKKWGKIAKKLGGVALFKSLSVKKSKEVDDESLLSRSTNNSKIVREVTVPDYEPQDESLSTLNTHEVITPVPSQQKSLSNIINHFEKSPPISESPKVSEVVKPRPHQLPSPKISEAVKSPPNKLPSTDEAACYLVYDPDSSGQLVEHYSKTPIDFAIGRWIPGAGKKIAGFKFKRNLGRNVLIGNCSGGVQGRKNFYSGWCQFVRSAKVMLGDVTLWDTAEGRKGLNVDVFLYFDDNRPTHQTLRMEEGISYTTRNLVAVACLPKGTPFFDNMKVDLLMWLAEGSKHGYSTKM